MALLPRVQDMGRRQATGAPRGLVQSDPNPPAPLEELGGALMRAAERQFTAQDAVSRARLSTQYDNEAAAELRRLETVPTNAEKGTFDISHESVVKGYGDFLAQREEELLSQHQGSLESRTALKERFLNLRATHSGDMAGRSVVAGRKLITDTLDNFVNVVTSTAYEDPAGFDDRNIEIENEYKEMSGGLPPGEERAGLFGAISKNVLSTVRGMIDRGEEKDVYEFLSRADVSKHLTPSEMRQARSKLTTRRIAVEKGRNELARKINNIESTLKIKLRPEQKLTLAGLGTKPGPQTVADKIREYEAISKTPATDEQIAKFYDIEADGASRGELFGKGLQGRALEMVTDLAPSFEAGLTSPTDERQLEAAMAAMRQPDPITGLRVTSPPPFLSNALAARGIDPVAAFNGDVSIVGVFAGDEPDEGAAVVSGEPDIPAAPDTSFFNRADDITGPIATGAAAATRIPGVGGLLPERANEMARARQEVTLAQQELVRTLQQNPRFSEGERQAIAKEVDISGATVDTPEAYQNRLIAIDTALVRRLEQAKLTSGSRTVSKAERAKANDLVNVIGPFLEQLGVPPLMNSVEEARQLPPGTVFRTPSGAIKQVPAAKKAASNDR